MYIVLEYCTSIWDMRKSTNLILEGSFLVVSRPIFAGKISANARICLNLQDLRISASLRSQHLQNIVFVCFCTILKQQFKYFAKAFVNLSDF